MDSQIEINELIDLAIPCLSINNAEKFEKIKTNNHTISKKVENLYNLFQENRFLKDIKEKIDKKDREPRNLYNLFISSQEYLLNRKIDAGIYRGYSMIMLAVNDSNLDMLKELISKGADVTCQSQNTNPLILAVKKGNLAILDILLKANANKGQRDSLGKTPLIRAVELSNIAIVKELLKIKDDLLKTEEPSKFNNSLTNISEVNIDHKDIFGKNALAYAILKYDEALLTILLHSRAKVNEDDLGLIRESLEDKRKEQLRVRIIRILRSEIEKDKNSNVKHKLEDEEARENLKKPKE